MACLKIHIQVTNQTRTTTNLIT